ncbi:MAG: SH3 domain-containing protein, partial [Bacteroidota bacterium]
PTTSTASHFDPTNANHHLLYVWLDRVYIRSTPSNKIRSIGRAENGQVLSWTGQRSEHEDTFVFRGIAYQEPWLEVEWENGQTGWVFGGAVKRANEEKDNAPLIDNQLYFDHFGKYHLAEWIKMTDETKGDTTRTAYRRENHLLKIINIEHGALGYTNIHQLLNKKGKLLRERQLRFIVDGNYKELVEIVADYIPTPAVQFSRSQALEKDHTQLNQRPQMVFGTWQKHELDIN